MIADRLDKHILGEVEMTATQIRAAEILLNKTLPNLSATELKATVETHDPNKLTDAELATIAAASSKRIAAKKNSKSKVH